MPGSSSACPKCQGPRDPKALYCPFCGVVFARFEAEARATDAAVPIATTQPPAPPPPGVAPPLAEPAGAPPGPPLDEVYQGPLPDEVYQGPPPDEIYQGTPPPSATSASPAARTPAPRGRAWDRDLRETPLTRHLLLSLLAAGLLFALSQVLFMEHVLSGSEDLERVRTEYTRVTGLLPPEEMTDALELNFVGRHVLVLAHGLAAGAEAPAGFPSFVVLYHHGRLADQADGETLKRTAQEKVRAFGLPVYRLSSRTSELAGQQVPTEIYGVGSSERSVGRLVYWTLTLADGRPAVLLLGGPTREVATLRRRHFS